MHTNAANMAKIVYRELSYRITGVCFRVHRELGRFARERQYADRMEALFRESCICYEREYELHRLDPSAPLGNRVDFLIDRCIVVECKTKPFITKEDYVQVQRYLHASQCRLGLLVNFRHVYLKPKRVLNSTMVIA